MACNLLELNLGFGLRGLPRTHTFWEAVGMSSVQTEFLGDDRPSSVPIHCAIHGTVLRCPFRYMSCEDIYIAQLVTDFSAEAWAAREEAINQAQERCSDGRWKHAV
jgi:hypothetical protein